MQITKRFPYYICLALLAYMPFHIFLSQSLSLATGGLDIWKGAKDVLLAVATLFVICLVWTSRRGTRVFNGLLIFTAVYAALHAVLWLMHPDIYRESAILGFVFNLRLFCFLILGYGAVRLLPDTVDLTPVVKLVILVGTIVAALGILQYFLPKDILTHVGYGVERGARESFFIDDKSGFPRIMSTLREPNALGAYLLVPMTLVALSLSRIKAVARKNMLRGSLLMMTFALLLTFSRSAWLAALISLGLVLLWQFRTRLAMVVKRFGWLLIALLIAAGAFIYMQRESTFVTSYIIHSSVSESEDLDSNQYHMLFLRLGITGVRDEPLGHGPGTAGLASIQNPEGSFLTENYYVQLGYEVGIIGALLFIGAQIWVYVRLWSQRNQVLGGALLASFWGYVFINMLLHIWSNEAVACQWWILAGMALALPPAAQKISKVK